MVDAFGRLRDVVDGRERTLMAMPGMSERILKAAGAILLCALTARAVQAAATRETPGEGPDAAAVALPQPPGVVLEPRPGFDDDAAYLRSVAERVESLLVAADQTEEPARQVAFSLAAANLILAEQLEPLCSRKLLHLEPGEPDRDGTNPRTLLTRSDKLIERGLRILDGLRETPDPPKGSWSEVRRGAQTLSAFSAAIRAYLAFTDDAGGKSGTREAASRLSPFLEDRNPGVAAAAAFWQARLRSLGTNTDAAVSMLDLTLADPPPNSMPYAFFARLLRSTLIAGRGGPASALALLLQMEERCQDWFTDDQERDLAIRTIQLTRLQIVSNWHDRLAGPDQDAARTWCVDRAKKLIAERFGEDRNFVLRLAPLIPIVAAPPAPPSGSADTPSEEP